MIPDLPVDLVAFKLYLLMGTRMSGIFMFAPIFGTRSVPMFMKVGLVAVTTYLFFVTIPMSKNVADVHLLVYAIYILKELSIGIAIGYVAQILFGAIQFAGKMIDMMMGLHVASVFDPMTHEQQSLMGQLLYIMAIFFFLQVDGHHIVIEAVGRSFYTLPIGALSIHHSLIDFFIQIVNTIFLVGLQIAAPIAAILFLIDFSLGLVAKAVPQMNVFLLGMPLKIMIGFMFLMVMLIYILPVLSQLFGTIRADIQKMILLMYHG